jgi:glucokinase
MHILCFESGGTKLVASVADLDGRLSDTVVEPRPAGQTAPETLDQLTEMGRTIVAGRPLSAIGFGFGGTVRRRDRRPTLCFHEEGWESTDAGELLSKRFGVPALIENDCKLAALAEAWQEDSPPSGSLLYLTIGTGIGAGVVRNGYLVELGDLGEAELGHVVVEPDGLPCGCGNRGCLEVYCSGPGLRSLARRMTGTDMEPAKLMQGYHRGDETERAVVEQAAEYLGRVLGTAVNLFAPEQIVLGGGVMTRNESFLDLIRARAARYAFAPFWSGVRQFRLSRLGPSVVCQGAAIYVLQQRGRARR